MFKKILISAFAFFLPLITFAGDNYGLSETAGAAGLVETPLPQRLGQVINAVFGVAGIIFLILAVYGGFRIFLSAGDADNYKKGRDIILWAVIGMVIITLAYALTTFVFSQFVGVQPT